MTRNFAQIDLRLFGQTLPAKPGAMPKLAPGGLSVSRFIADVQEPIRKTIPGLGMFGNSDFLVYQDGHFEMEIWLSIFDLQGRDVRSLYENVSKRLMSSFPQIERITSVPEEESLERIANLPGFELDENGDLVRTDETFDELKEKFPGLMEG